MFKLHIPAMSCSHCAGVITHTLDELDALARITFDMPARIVEITCKQSPDVVMEKLAAAGYRASLA